MKKRKLLATLCLVLSCSMLSGCVFTEPVISAGKALGRMLSESEEDEDFDEDYFASQDIDELPEIDELEELPEIEELESWEDEESFASTESSAEGKVAPEGSYAQTIMIYMVGSDLESEYGNGSLDLQEMMGAAADTDYNNVVVYTGGASEWQINGLSADQNTTLLLTDAEDFEIVDSHSAKNMGEADTLSSFINFCLDNYEAESYGLILWNHGAGPVYGFGVDENYQDILTVDELQKAFEDSVGTRNQRLEWVGFDACIMNSLEIADLLAPYANYMIASQETEPGWGWNYDFLNETSNRVLTGAEMGELIIDYYMGYGDAVFEISPRLYCDLTLSCIDLNKYQAAEDALNRCFSELDEELTVETYPELVRNREHTRDFGTYASTFDYGMVDAVHLLNQIAFESDSAAEAIEAIESMVVYSQSNMRNANGISICYPYSSSDEYAQDCVTLQEELGFSDEYTGFLKKFYSIQNGESFTGEWNLAEAETSVAAVEAEDQSDVAISDVSLQLTEEQQANFANADYFILAKVKDAGYEFAEDDPRADDMYMFVHMGKDVKLDEDGVLHGYYGNQVLYLHDLVEEVYSPIPMILFEQERTEEEIRYMCLVTMNNWNLTDLENWVVEAANLQIVVNKDYPNGVIRSAVPLADEGEVNPSKQLLDLADFGILEVTAGARYFTRGKNGEMLNFYEWEDSGWILGFDHDLRNEYELEMRPLEDPENYVCMFRIKDVQGNVSYSELISLE